MTVGDFFNQEGIRIPIEGNKPQILDDEIGRAHV